MTGTEGFLAYTASTRTGFREKVWCHRHADCAALNWRWCCVPFGNRQLAVNGVSIGGCAMDEHHGLKSILCRPVKCNPEPITVWCDKPKNKCRVCDLMEPQPV